MNNLIFITVITFLTRIPLSLEQNPDEAPAPPEGFPLPLILTDFVNWANDIEVRGVWTAYPEKGDDVVAAANWAIGNGYNLRGSGLMHTWSPITITDDEEGTSPQQFNCGREHEYNYTRIPPGLPNPTPAPAPPVAKPPPKVILLKTRDKMNKLGIISTQPANSSFWSEPGALLEDVMTMLEANNLGFLASPAPGNITFGGALTIGGHGTGVPATRKNETLSPGHTYGTLSNLIISFTAVVYDGNTAKYILKEFHRSDTEAKAFLLTLGRTFITNFTVRAGPLQYLRCRSYVNIPATDLFDSPESQNVDAVSTYLDKAGRLEVILFPFTTLPWLKVWNVLPCNCQPCSPISRHVREPYNYPFSDNIPMVVADMVALIQQNQQYYLAPALGNLLYFATVNGLVTTLSFDLWGASKNLLLYVKPSTLRYTANGYAVLTNRANVQRVLYECYTYYSALLKEYEAIKKYPINGPLEIRVTGLDHAADVLVEGAESPALSSVQSTNPDYDSVVWFDILTLSKTPYVCDFMTDVENFFLQTFNGSYASVKIEWSKGWAYTTKSPWANETFFDIELQSSISNFQFYKEIMDKYDPNKIFTDKFLRRLLANNL